jgi:hypothetical protein
MRQNCASAFPRHRAYKGEELAKWRLFKGGHEKYLSLFSVGGGFRRSPQAFVVRAPS